MGEDTGADDDKGTDAAKVTVLAADVVASSSMAIVGDRSCSVFCSGALCGRRRRTLCDDMGRCSIFPGDVAESVMLTTVAGITWSVPPTATGDVAQTVPGVRMVGDVTPLV